MRRAGSGRRDATLRRIAGIMRAIARTRESMQLVVWALPLALWLAAGNVLAQATEAVHIPMPVMP